MKYLYNTTGSDKVYVGKTVPSLGYYLIPTSLEVKFSIESSLLVDIANSQIVVSKIDSASGHISDVNTAIDYLKANLPTRTETTVYPFSSKILPDGRKLFKRVHGVTAAVAGAPDSIIFTIPYTNCKLTAIEIIGADLGDTVNLKILDTNTGTVSGIPNYTLNQFGFSVNVTAGFYSHYSEYDADLSAGLQIKLEYDAINSDLLPKTIGINFVLNEVVNP